jgi:Zn-finger nucleic acid-binding protein
MYSEKVVMTKPAFACPYCRLPLFAGRTVSTVVHACGHCGGVWLDNAASQRILRSFDGDAVMLAHTADVRANAPYAATIGAAVCPECTAELERVNVEAARAFVDICKLHGTWFNRGDLALVSQAFERTRLHRAPTTGPVGRLPFEDEEGDAAEAVSERAPARSEANAAEAAIDVALGILSRVRE